MFDKLSGKSEHVALRARTSCKPRVDIAELDLANTLALSVYPSDSKLSAPRMRMIPSSVQALY
jgi:hypothetical protein